MLATHRLRRPGLPITAAILLSASAGLAQAPPPGEPASDLAASYYDETTVTVTGNEIDTFEVAQPVVVLDAETIDRRQPDSATDLLRDQVGVDVNGVGPNQSRPIIRGQRGLRVLFLENGLRMNNARRQTDFGEIPGLVDIESVEAVEVVRGPASVLYGTDAIGGVLNLVTHEPSWADRTHGGLRLLGSTAGDQLKATGSVAGSAERFA